MKFIDLFRFSPRASREEFALISLCGQIVSLLFYAVEGLFGPHSVSWVQLIGIAAAGLFLCMLFLGLFWITLAVSWRRMHDLNLSGCWYLGYYIAVMALSVVFTNVWWLFSLMGLGVMLLLCLKKSAPPNRFGQAPAVFLPTVFSRRGMFTAVIVLCVFVSLGQVFLSRMQLSFVQARQRVEAMHQPF